MSDPVAGVVKLVTVQERAEQERAAYTDAAADEAISMLERALLFARSRRPGERLVGVAIALSLEDQSYGRILPLRTVDMSRLVGSIASMQHELLAFTATAHEPLEE